MKAINFNWNTSKMTEGERYDFTFDGSPAQCYKNGSTFAVEDGESHATCKREIFRAGASVLDMLAICICKAGEVRSGEVYRASLLIWNNPDYTSSAIYRAGVDCPSTHAEHNTPREECPYYYGFELEVSCRTRETFDAAAAIRSNIVRKVSDSSISDRGIEFVSGALIAPADAVNPAFYEDFCGMLTGLAISRTDSTTGLHFHVSRAAFGETEAEQLENIAKAVYMENYVLNQEALTRVFGRPAGGSWCRQNATRGDFAQSLAAVTAIAGRRIMNDVDIRAALTNDLTPYNATRVGHTYPYERYQRINLTNPATIEFRQGKGDINSKSLARIAQHVDTLVKYCKNTKWGTLNEAGYLRSIPSSNKYSILRDCWQSVTE